MKNSLVAGIYEKTEDRESAYEKLTQRVQEQAAAQGIAADAQAIREAEMRALREGQEKSADPYTLPLFTDD